MTTPKITITPVKLIPPRRGSGPRTPLSIKVFNALNTQEVGTAVAIRIEGKPVNLIYSYVTNARQMLLPKVFHATMRDDTVYVRRMS